MVEDMLKNAALSVSDVDTFAVNVGPGSFTGVRIGVAAVKGLAFAQEKPCAAVSTLHSMAYNFIGLPGVQTVCAVMDARCAQVYTALFEVNGDTVTRLTEDAALPIAELKLQLAALGKTVILVGDGAQLCYTALKDEVDALVLAPDHLRYQSAEGVALAAQTAETCSAAALQPKYLRLPQAERELKAKLASHNA
jgi:tRNA threonylcarbamoyladenosine biosynthesis protein TsaB